MSLTASNLIESAKASAFGGTGSQKVSLPMLLAELTHQDMLVWQTLSQIEPDLFTTVTGAIALLTSSGNQNGYGLQSGIHYRDFVHVDASDDEYTPIAIRQRQHRDTDPPAPAGMIRAGTSGATFYPIDPLAKRWAGSETREWFEPGTHTVTYSYVPAPSEVTSLSQTLVSPDMARPVMVASLKLAILMAAPRVDEAKLQEAAAQRTAAWQTLIMQAHKYVHPAGERSRGSSRSEADWIADQVGS